MQFHAETLAKSFTGVLFVGGEPRDATFGSMRVVCNSFGKGVLGKLIYVATVLRQAVREARQARVPPVIVSYDPLRNGLTALALRSLTGGVMICQVNGIHTSPDLLPEGPNSMIDRMRRRVMIAATRFVLAHSDGIRVLFPGHLDAYNVRASGQVVRSYFDPVKLDRFTNRGEEKMILCVGFPFKVKGIDTLLKSFLSVRDEFKDWRLTLIGFELERHIDAHVADRSGIEVIPAMPNEKVAHWIGRCGIFVLPSRTEAMGRVLLEAAASGKPRVGSDVGGIPTVIEHGVDGLLFPKGDVQALAGHLRYLMNSSTERKRLGDAALKRVHEEFTPERFLEHFEEQVDAVCDRSLSGQA